MEEKEEFQIEFELVDILTSLFQDFKIVLSDSKPIEKYLYCQIYIEHVVDAIINTGAYNPSFLKLNKMSFATKVDYCVALGYIHKEMRAPIVKVGNLRNEFAHTINAEINDEKIKDLRNDLQRASKNNLPIYLKPNLKIANNIFSDCFQQMWNYLFFQYYKLSSNRDEMFMNLRNCGLVSDKPEFDSNATPKSISETIAKAAKNIQHEVETKYSQSFEEYIVEHKLVITKRN